MMLQLKNQRKKKHGPNKKLIISHRLPKAKQRTNAVVDGYVPQGQLLRPTPQGEREQATY